MRAFTPRAASLRTSASASGRVLYAASWMVQRPRGADAFEAGSVGPGGVSVGAFRARAAGGVRVVTVSARRGDVMFGDPITGAELVAGTLLGELGGGDVAMLGDPDDRTVGVLAAAVGLVAAESTGGAGSVAP